MGHPRRSKGWSGSGTSNSGQTILPITHCTWARQPGTLTISEGMEDQGPGRCTEDTTNKRQKGDAGERAF